MPSESALDHVVQVFTIVGALGLVVLGLRTLMTRRVPRPLVRIRGAAAARQPRRLGGAWLLLGAAILMSSTGDLVDMPDGPHTVVSAAAGVGILAAVVWFAVQKN